MKAFPQAIAIGLLLACLSASCSKLAASPQASLTTGPVKHSISNENELNTQYANLGYHYSVLYSPLWQISEWYGNTSFITASGAVFSVGVNTGVGGVPTIAYYAALGGTPLRPFTTASLRNFTDVCALRDDTHVYVQRGDVVYTLTVAASSDVENPSLIPADLNQQFDHFASSFSFLEPWSDTSAPKVSPEIPVPCWR